MGSKTITCPVCNELGYLIKEKPRPKKYRKTSRYYPSRVSHPIFEVAHNIKKEGKWRSKRCYLGIYRKVLDFAKKMRLEGEQEWEHKAFDSFTRIEKYYRLEDSSVGLPTDIESKQNIANILFHFSGNSLSHNSPIRVKVDPRRPINFLVDHFHT